jgi:hypothetical protein
LRGTSLIAHFESDVLWDRRVIEQQLASSQARHQMVKILLGACYYLQLLHVRLQQFMVNVNVKVKVREWANIGKLSEANDWAHRRGQPSDGCQAFSISTVAPLSACTRTTNYLPYSHRPLLRLSSIASITPSSFLRLVHTNFIPSPSTPPSPLAKLYKGLFPSHITIS